MNATLALEDGTWYRGVAAGAPGETARRSRVQHEHDRLSGSADRSVLRRADRHDDRAAHRQLRRRAGDAESQAPHVAGFIMREAVAVASNWRADGDASRLPGRHNIVAIADIDTRALTRVLRSAGVMRGVIATGQVDPDALVEKARAIPQMEGSDLVRGVTCDSAVRVARPRRGVGRPTTSSASRRSAARRRRLRVAAYDFGIKWNILRRLDAYGCDVRVFPGRRARASDLLAIEPDGIFLSNGPGDPAALPYADRQRSRRWSSRTCRCSASASATRFSAWRCRRPDVQAEVRPSRRESSGEGARHRQDRDHLAESWLRGRSRARCRPTSR